jgi:hypothetical protein
MPSKGIQVEGGIYQRPVCLSTLSANRQATGRPTAWLLQEGQACPWHLWKKLIVMEIKT